MLSINNVSYLIGGRLLFEEASLHIKPKDRIGLVGLNGKGKSTLLKLINRDLQVDKGSISRAKECTVGFLNQDLLSYSTQESILSVAMQAFKESVETKKKIDTILQKLETEYTDSLVENLTTLQEKFDNLDGYSMQAKAEEILEGVGFTTEQLTKPIQEFSGGWRMRVMLTKLLLEKPSLLLLDEPTNHLDLPSIKWIENYLKTYEGSVVIVSHDRQFLNSTVLKTVEVSNKTLTLYEGNFDYYLKEKELRSEIQNNSFANQQQQIKQAERFIDRFRAQSTKARQVQSKIKSLNRLERIDEVVDKNAIVNFKFEFSQKPGNFITQLNNISKHYGNIEILKNTTARIDRGDKIALIGANGRGKSTLLRIIAGSESVDGECIKGFNVNTSFYAQHQLESLDMNNELLEELKCAGSSKTEQELRNVLGCFLFSGDDVFKKIKVLSGGEKSRVALAKTLISEANFLMLDEPTNHLDMQSENILIQALKQYKGSLVTVSHNRHFITEIATKIWYIENKKIKEYPGTFLEYEHWRDHQQLQKAPVSSNKISTKKKKKKKPKLTGPNKLVRLEKELVNIESAIIKTEENLKRIEEKMLAVEVYSNLAKLTEANTLLKDTTKELEKKQSQWESIAIKIDEFQSGE